MLPSETELPAASPPPRPETGHLSALFKVALCLQDNVAEGNGADTTGNLPVSEEAALVAEVVGCRHWSVPVELLRLRMVLSLPCRPASSKAGDSLTFWLSTAEPKC